MPSLPLLAGPHGPGVLPEAERVAVAASACFPLPLPCVYRVRTGLRRPGRSRLLSASAVRAAPCTSAVNTAGVEESWHQALPLAACPLPRKLSKVEPQAALPARSPGQGAPRSPSDEDPGVRTSRDKQVLCRGPCSWTQGSFSSCFPFKLKQDLPRLPCFEAVWGAGGRQSRRWSRGRPGPGLRSPLFPGWAPARVHVELIIDPSAAVIKAAPRTTLLENKFSAAAVLTEKLPLSAEVLFF